MLEQRFLESCLKEKFSPSLHVLKQRLRVVYFVSPMLVDLIVGKGPPDDIVVSSPTIKSGVLD